jgi:prevent-host-death family protein
MRISIVDFRNQLAEPINRVAYQGERVILERRGKGVAALVSMEDLALLEKLEDESDLKAARAAIKERGEIPFEKVKAELGLRGLGRVAGPASSTRERASKPRASAERKSKSRSTGSRPA